MRPSGFSAQIETAAFPETHKNEEISEVAQMRKFSDIKPSGR
jgi:hypothetical protein